MSVIHLLYVENEPNHYYYYYYHIIQYKTVKIKSSFIYFL